MSQPRIKCLIDTNILIGVEGQAENEIIGKAFGEFASSCQRHGVALYCHPASIEDIQRDRNETRKQSTLSRFAKYPVLEKVPQLSSDELAKLFGGIHKPNDFVDCCLLYTLSLNIVDFLISEDEGVHKRARQAGLNPRVFSVKEFSSQLRQWFEPQLVQLPHVVDEPVHALNLSDPLFVSLREDYKGFDAWIKNKCIPEGRRAWTVKDGDRLQAICIYNPETEATADFPGLGSKPLKLCTFKVADSYRGTKLGELLLKEAFIYCVKNRFSTCYLTTKPKQQYLVEFLGDFGFKAHPTPKQSKDGLEIGLYKTFVVPKDLVPMPPVDFAVTYWPAFQHSEEIRKFVVPIQPQYHDVLFPEFSTQMSLGLRGTTKMAPGNTLKKAYLCNAKIRALPAGSIIMFYRSKDKSEIVSLGIVESCYRTSNSEEAVRVVGKRSVYNLDEIEALASKEVLIIIFRWITNLEAGLTLSSLKRDRVLEGQPQSVQEMSHDKFLKISDLLETFAYRKTGNG